jgi:hypothetical protein
MDDGDDISIYEMNEGSGPWITAQGTLLQKYVWFLTDLGWLIKKVIMMK